MGYSDFPVFGFLAAVLVLVPLPRLVRARNIAGIALVYWIFQASIIIAVNALIFNGNVRNSAPVWCRIVSKLKDGAPMAVASSTLCISRHLEFIASGSELNSDFLQRRRRSFELVMCFAVPCLWMFIFYCFQKDDFLIVEDFGCCDQYFPSFISFVILFVPPLLLSGAAVIYGSVTLLHILSRRSTPSPLTSYLKSRDPALSSSQTLRLVALSILLAIPGTVWISGMYQELTFVGLVPLPDWDTIHLHRHVIATLPASKITASHRRSLTIRWWSLLTEAFIVFLLFATSHDVLYEYQRLWGWFKITVLRRPPPEMGEWNEVKTNLSIDSVQSEVPPSMLATSNDLEANSKVLGIPIPTRIFQGVQDGWTKASSKFPVFRQ